MRLDYIIKGIDIERADGPLETEITDITSDSRQCRPGCLFVAIPGFDSDGHDYIAKAADAGAAAVIYQKPEALREILGRGMTAVRVKDSRNATPDIAGNFFSHPSRGMHLVGVTGTNGKTTIATLLYRLFTGLGYCCGLLSTIANYICGERFETTNTTQDPITLNRLMRMMVDRGCQYCFMEVSSHALHQGRVGRHFHQHHPRPSGLPQDIHGIHPLQETALRLPGQQCLRPYQLRRPQCTDHGAEYSRESLPLQRGQHGRIQGTDSGAQPGGLPAQSGRDGGLDPLHRGLQRPQYLRGLRRRRTAWRMCSGPCWISAVSQC